MDMNLTVDGISISALYMQFWDFNVISVDFSIAQTEVERGNY
jgi:hypothetical protein